MEQKTIKQIIKKAIIGKDLSKVAFKREPDVGTDGYISKRLDFVLRQMIQSRKHTLIPPYKAVKDIKNNSGV